MFVLLCYANLVRKFCVMKGFEFFITIIHSQNANSSLKLRLCWDL
jgi:hypothetical protein